MTNKADRLINIPGTNSISKRWRMKAQCKALVDTLHRLNVVDKPVGWNTYRSMYDYWEIEFGWRK